MMDYGARERQERAAAEKKKAAAEKKKRLLSRLSEVTDAWGSWATAMGDGLERWILGTLLVALATASR